MKNIPIVAFAGYSGAGKTTIIERLVCELKSRNKRVAVIKHDGHRFEIDHKGKDSWRFMQAGADITMISSVEKTAYIERRELSLWQLIDMVHDVDIILVEGYKNQNLPQIGIARKATGKYFTADLNRFIALVTDIEDIETTLPCFAMDDTHGLTEFVMGILRGFSDTTDKNDRRC